MFKCAEECQDRLLATRLLSLKSFHIIENNYGMTKVLGMNLHTGALLDTKHGLEFFYLVSRILRMCVFKNYDS